MKGLSHIYTCIHSLPGWHITLSREEWIERMWYISTIAYYLAIKKNETIPFAATWMDLGVLYRVKLVRQRMRNIFAIF